MSSKKPRRLNQKNNAPNPKLNDPSIMIKKDLFEDFHVTDAYDTRVFRGYMNVKDHGKYRKVENLVYKSDISQPHLFKTLKRNMSKDDDDDIPFLVRGLWDLDQYEAKYEARDFTLIQEIDAYTNLNDKSERLTPKLVGIDICSTTGRIRGIILEDAGPDLKQSFKQNHSLTPDAFENFALTMLKKLYQMHQLCFVHRDIKLNNCVNPQDIQFIDFGLSKRLSHPDDSGHESAHVGTPGHVPPELLLFSANVDWKKCDVWSLCAALAALLVGQSRIFANENYRFFIDMALMFGNEQYQLKNLDDWLESHSKLRLWFNPAMVEYKTMIEKTVEILELTEMQQKNLYKMYSGPHVDTDAIAQKYPSRTTRLIDEVALDQNSFNAQYRINVLNPTISNEVYEKCHNVPDLYKVECVTSSSFNKPSRWWEFLVWSRTFAPTCDPNHTCTVQANAIAKKIIEDYKFKDLHNLEYGDLDIVHHPSIRKLIDDWWNVHFESDKIDQDCERMLKWSVLLRKGMSFDPRHRPELNDLIQTAHQIANKSSPESYRTISMKKIEPIPKCSDVMLEMIQFTIDNFWTSVDSELSFKAALISKDNYQPFVHHGIDMFVNWSSQTKHWDNPIPRPDQWESFIADGKFNTTTQYHLTEQAFMLFACLKVSAILYLDNHVEMNVYLRDLFNEDHIDRYHGMLYFDTKMHLKDNYLNLSGDEYDKESYVEDEEEEDDFDSSDSDESVSDTISHPSINMSSDLGTLIDDDDDESTIILNGDEDFDESNQFEKITFDDVVNSMIHRLIKDTQLKSLPPAMNRLSRLIPDGAVASKVNAAKSVMHYLTKPIDPELFLLACVDPEVLEPIYQHQVPELPFRDQYDQKDIRFLISSLDLNRL